MVNTIVLNFNMHVILISSYFFKLHLNMFNIFLIILIPICVLLIIQTDRIYPKIFINFIIYYAWALSFCNFLLVVKALISLLSHKFNFGFDIFQMSLLTRTYYDATFETGSLCKFYVN